MTSYLAKMRGFASANQRLTVLSAIGLFFISFYVVLKVQAQDDRRVIFQKAALDLNKTRILGEPSEEVLRGKSQRLDKNASDLIEKNQALLERLSGLEAKINQLSNREQAPQTPPIGANPAVPPVLADQDQPALDNSPGLEQPSKAEGKPVRFSESSSPFDARIIGHTKPMTRLRTIKTGPSIMNFPVARDKEAEELTTSLPSGSYVKGVVLTGVDAHQEEWPVLIQLDYAFIGPNQSRIDLSGCFVIAKAKGDLSIERAIMQTEKLSCVAENGEMFERQVNGWVSDDSDNKFGVAGPVNSKRGRVLSTAFLASLVEGVGKAIQMAETTTQTTPLGGAQSVVTGERGAYALGGAAATASSKVADWYLKQAENLLPSITVGSGRRVWITVKDKVHLPVTFFKPTMVQGVSDEKPNLFGRVN